MLLYPHTDSYEIGVDEVGRGCLAFEVCAAAVLLPNKSELSQKQLDILENVKDSKKISKKKRNELASFIKTISCYGIGTASVKEIEEKNILEATYIAMHRAIGHIDHFNNIMVDGDRFTPYQTNSGWLPHVCVKNADSIHLHVACASIIAKTYRDNLVHDYCNKQPWLDERYKFLKNKAYGTKQHYEGLKTHKASEYHRKTFKLHI